MDGHDEAGSHFSQFFACFLLICTFRFNLYCGGFILFCSVCMSGFCNVCVCEGFVMCGCFW